MTIFKTRESRWYRSLHLIYKYKNKHAPQYNDLKVELQIRTKLQHVWATAMETMGTFLGQALKSRQGDKKWIDFFAVVSSAFAHQEKTSLVPHCAKLSRKETFLEVAQAEKDLGALEIMDGFALRLMILRNKECREKLVVSLNCAGLVK